MGLSLKEVEIVGVCDALGDPLRFRLLQLIIGNPGLNLMELCGHFEISRFGVMKHLNILEERRLIRRVVSGKERLHYHCPEVLVALREGLLKNLA